MQYIRGLKRSLFPRSLTDDILNFRNHCLTIMDMQLEKPQWLQIGRISDQNGTLGILELPFGAKRTYFIQKVDEGAERGFHAHRSLRQIFFAPHGSFELELSTPSARETFLISTDDRRGLFVPPGYWRILTKFSPDAICMVLASDHFDEGDYIRNFDEYVDWFKERFLSEN